MSDKALKIKIKEQSSSFSKLNCNQQLALEDSLVQLSVKRRRVSEGQSRPRIHFQFIETVSEWLPGFLRTKSSGFKPFNVLRNSKRSHTTAKSKGFVRQRRRPSACHSGSDAPAGLQSQQRRFGAQSVSFSRVNRSSREPSAPLSSPPGSRIKSFS